ncbi:hypothetical protein RhoFasSB10_05183 [Rhodococcus fascians]|nr:hypothetical protein [Rhodococcus fascians]
MAGDTMNELVVSVPPVSTAVLHVRTKRFLSWGRLLTVQQCIHTKRLLRKEVIQPHLPVRLPCYDFVPIADPTFDGSLPVRG